jgi:hypothetical protein
MIKIHNSDEGASSLLKISLSEKEKLKKTNSLARLSQEKNEMRDNYIFFFGLFKILSKQKTIRNLKNISRPVSVYLNQWNLAT